MRKLLFSLFVFPFITFSLHAKDQITLQLKWVPQAQFMGYYVAKEKGFYTAENLDVILKAGGPDIAPPQVIAGGGADLIVEWLGTALSAKEKGVDLVNVAQIFKKSSLMLTCRKDSGIQSSKDLRGKTVGVWFFGNEYPFLAWMAKLNLPIDGKKDSVTVLKQGFNVDPLLQNQAACISTTSYNEYQQVLEAGMAEKDLINFVYQDQGVGTLEDGIYSLQKNLENKEMFNKIVRFVRASLKGWNYASTHQEEAVEIVLKNDNTGAQTKAHQTTMAKEVAKLLDKKQLGYLDPKDFDRTVNILLSGKSTPVITKKPTHAWTHEVWKAL